MKNPDNKTHTIRTRPPWKLIHMPKGWDVMKNSKGKFAPRDPNGVIYEAVGPGQLRGGNFYDAVKCAWEMVDCAKAQAKRDADWKVFKP